MTRTMRALAIAVGLVAFAGEAFAQAPATCVISGNVLDGGSNPVVGANVRIRTVVPTAVGNYGITTNDLTTVTGAGGAWSLTVIAGLKAQIDIPAIGVASDIIVPSVGSCPVSFGSLTLYARGTQTPQTIISTAGPSMGGDLTGTSPNPSVIALRGQALAVGNCTNGQARVWASGSNAYTCQTVTTGTYVQSITAGAGITVTGTTNPTVAVTTGGISNALMQAGAASANVGALSGALTGTLPSPSLNAGAAAANIGTLGGDLAGTTLPNPAVATVGGASAANIAAGVALANAATNANTPSTIVKRDGGGNFTAGTITANLTGTATNATNITGSLTGDVTNSGNAVTVTGLQGRAVSNAAPTSGYALIWGGASWAPTALTGTVSSVNASGGSTGFSFTGGPITGSGTLTLTGTLGLANGGTGQTSAAAAFNTLAPLTTVGDILYEAAGPTAARLAGNATTTKNFLTSTGTGAAANPPAWGTIAAGDLPATINANTTGSAASLSATLAIGSGGTGQATAPNAFNALAPTTTLGDTIYASGAGANSRLAGNTTTTRKFYRQTGDGVNSAAPAWDVLVSGDIPNNAANTSGTAGGLSATLGVASGGTGAATFSAGILHSAGGTAALTSSAVSLTADVTGTLGLGNGGTGQTTASAAYNALSPTTTLGDIAYANGAGTNTRLAGNTTATKQFLNQTGNGSISAAPAWGVLAAGDIPNLDTSKITTGTFTVGFLPNAAGDVTGALTSNTVTKIQGNPVLSGTPTNLQVLQYITANNRWEPTTLSGGGAVSSVSGSGGTTGLTLTGGPTGAVTLTLGGTLAVANGGTGQTTAGAAFDALSPMTTLGDVIYGGSAGAGTRLGGNTSTTPKYLQSTGTGAAAQAPTFAQVAFSDLSGNAATAQGGTNKTTWSTGSVPYLSSATQFAEDNANLFYDATNKRLGVGTGAPSAIITAKSTSGSTSSILGTTNDYVAASTGTSYQFTFGASSGNTYTALNAANTGGGTAGALVLNSNSGNVGVNQTAPAAHLHVTDTSGTTAARVDGNTTTGRVFDLLGADRTWSFVQGGTSTAANGFGIRDQTAGATRLAFDSGGLVGIGTTAPVAGLEVRRDSLYNAENSGIALRTGSVAGEVALYLNTDKTNLVSSIASVNPSTGARKMAINPAGGNVGIGTITPDSNASYGANQSVLTVKGSSGTSSYGVLQMATAQADADGVLTGNMDFVQPQNVGGDHRIAVIQGTATGITATNRGGALGFWTKGNNNPLAERARFDNSGNFGIGTTTPEVQVDQTGAHQLRGMAAPAVSSSGNARLYFDSTSKQLRLSQDGGAYVNVLGSGGVSGNASSDQLAIWTGGTTVGGFSGFVRNSGTGFIGLNQGTPAAQLDVNGAVRLEAISAPGSPGTGDTWTDSTQKAAMSYQAGATQALGGVLWTLTSGCLIVNSTTETDCIGTAGIGTKTLPANFWTIGKTIEVWLFGVFPATSAASPNYTVRFKVGGTTLATSAGNFVGYPGTGLGWYTRFILTCRTTGVSGTVIGQGQAWSPNSPVGATMPMTAAATIDTTASAAIAFTFQASGASAADSLSSTNAYIRVLN